MTTADAAKQYDFYSPSLAYTYPREFISATIADFTRQAEEDLHGTPCPYCRRMSGSRLKRLGKKTCEGCGAPASN